MNKLKFNILNNKNIFKKYMIIFKFEAISALYAEN